MNQNEAVLRAFFAEKLEENGVTADPALLNRLHEYVEIREGRSNVKEEERYIRIKKDTEDQPTAKRISLYNLLDISLPSLLDLLLEGAGLATMKGASKLAFALAVASLLNEFIKNSIVEINKTDAKILLAIHQLKKKRFTPEEVQAGYLDEFGEPLADEQLKRSLDSFKKSFILRYKSDNQYQLRERMSYDRT